MVAPPRLPCKPEQAYLFLSFPLWTLDFPVIFQLDSWSHVEQEMGNVALLPSLRSSTRPAKVWKISNLSNYLLLLCLRYSHSP